MLNLENIAISRSKWRNYRCKFAVSDTSNRPASTLRASDTGNYRADFRGRDIAVELFSP